MRLLYFLILSLLMVLAGPLQAVTYTFDFSDPVEESRYKSLIREIRCLVCQNQSLADSDAELAQDLRDETFKLMKSGRSDQEIIDFLVARYGDFVLYRPPLKPSTYLLWFGPFMLLGMGAFILVRTVRNRSRTSERPLTRDEVDRVSQLLDATENDTKTGS
jgi:cytochrome c-type biogenesis protein CcmH